MRSRSWLAIVVLVILQRISSNHSLKLRGDFILYTFKMMYVLYCSTNESSNLIILQSRMCVCMCCFCCCCCCCCCSRYIYPSFRSLVFNDSYQVIIVMHFMISIVNNHQHHTLRSPHSSRRHQFRTLSTRNNKEQWTHNNCNDVVCHHC